MFAVTISARAAVNRARSSVVSSRVDVTPMAVTMASVRLIFASVLGACAGPEYSARTRLTNCVNGIGCAMG